MAKPHGWTARVPRSAVTLSRTGDYAASVASVRAADDPTPAVVDVVSDDGIVHEIFTLATCGVDGAVYIDGERQLVVFNDAGPR